LIGLRMLTLSKFFAGQYAQALAHADAAIAGYDGDRHTTLAARFSYDPLAAALNYKAWSLWHLGDPQGATEAIAKSLAWSRAGAHP
jgi:hypothetical protein